MLNLPLCCHEVTNDLGDAYYNRLHMQKSEFLALPYGKLMSARVLKTQRRRRVRILLNRYFSENASENISMTNVDWIHLAKAEPSRDTWASRAR